MSINNRHGPILFAAAIMLVATLVTLRPALAQNAAACQGVTFSADVLSRFPNAAQECLDVITRDGQHYALFKAQLIRVDGSRLRLRMKQPDGSLGEAITVKPRKDLKVMVDGQSISVDQLAPNQELSAYVRVDKPEVALVPAAPQEPLELEPVNVQPAPPAPAVAARNTPVMPRTASQNGILALMAGLSLLVASASVALRTMNRRRRLEWPPSP